MRPLIFALILLINLGLTVSEDPEDQKPEIEPSNDEQSQDQSSNDQEPEKQPSNDQPSNDQPQGNSGQYLKLMNDVNSSMKLLQSEYSKAIEILKRRQEKGDNNGNSKKMDDVITNLQGASERVKEIHKFVRQALKDEKRKEDIMPYLEKLYDFEYKRIKAALGRINERTQSDQPQRNREVDVPATNEVTKDEANVQKKPVEERVEP